MTSSPRGAAGSSPRWCRISGDQSEASIASVSQSEALLRPSEECVEVPQEVCGVSRVKPVKKQRPAIQFWCRDNTGEGEAVDNELLL